MKIPHPTQSRPNSPVPPASSNSNFRGPAASAPAESSQPRTSDAGPATTAAFLTDATGSHPMKRAKAQFSSDTKLSFPPNYRPKSTQLIMEDLLRRGTQALVTELAEGLPVSIQTRELVTVKSEVADKPPIIASETHAEIDTPVLQSLAQCCVADRYKEKYDVDLYLSPSKGMPQSLREVFKAHLNITKPLGLLVSNVPLGEDKKGTGFHTVPIAVLPDSDGMKCSAFLMDSIAIDDSGYSSQITRSTIDFMASLNGYKVEWFASPFGRQADTGSCHTDALQVLKEVLKENGSLGYKMVGDARLSDGQNSVWSNKQGLPNSIPLPYPASLQKTAQRSAFLQANQYASNQTYGKSKTIGDHRTSHTHQTSTITETGVAQTKNRNLFLHAKSLQYANVASTYLASVPEDMLSEAKDDLLKRRVLIDHPLLGNGES